VDFLLLLWAQGSSRPGFRSSFRQVLPDTIRIRASAVGLRQGLEWWSPLFSMGCALSRSQSVPPWRESAVPWWPARPSRPFVGNSPSSGGPADDGVFPNRFRQTSCYCGPHIL